MVRTYVRMTREQRLAQYIERIKFDLTCDLPLYYEDGSEREPRRWPNGALSVYGLVSWYGRKAFMCAIYRNPDRTMFAMDNFGRKRRVNFDEIEWELPK